MENNNAIYSLSKTLVRANPLLSNDIKYIDFTGLETLIRLSARTIIFKWDSAEIILEIINNKKINKKSQFICIDNQLEPHERYQLSSNGIKFINIQKYIDIDRYKFMQWSAHENYKVLVVDDDIVEALDYENTFKKAGIRVKNIHPDIEILESIKHYQPDLLFMILNIDEIAADEFVKLIRSDPEYLILPIVFLSKEISQKSKQKVLDVGADEVLFKPMHSKELTYKLINRMQSHFFQLLNIVEEFHASKSIYHTVKDVEHEKLVSFIAEAQNNDSATVIWLKINNKLALQKKFGLSGFKNLCEDFLIQLPMFHVIFSLKYIISEGIFVLASENLSREHANRWVENIHHWLSNNYFAVRNKEFNIIIQAFILTHIPKKSNNELLIYEAERLLVNSKSNQVITYISEGEDQKHFYLIKTKLENAIKAKDFKWIYQSIISVKEENQEIFQLMLKVLTNDGKELKSIDYLDIANQTGLLRLLDRYTLEHAIRLIQHGEQNNNHRCILINQLISDYESDQHRCKIFEHIKKQKLPAGKLVFQFRQDLTEEHTSLLNELGKELRIADITICLSEFDATPMAWSLAKALDVHWLRIKPFGIQSKTLLEHNPDYLGNVIKKAQNLGYEVMVPNIDSANLTANIWKLNADYIHGNFIQSPVSDIHLIEGNMTA